MLQILEEAVQFIREALEDDLNNVLVACSKGAARSLLAYSLFMFVHVCSISPLVHWLKWEYEATVGAGVGHVVIVFSNS